MTRNLVLVVDDDDATQTLMSRYLQSLGIQAMTAGDGEHALEVLREHSEQIALVLLDIAMPRMNGYELARAVRAEPGLADLPLIAITARVGPHVDTQAIEAGINDIIQKPFEPKHLKRILAELALLG